MATTALRSLMLLGCVLAPSVARAQCPDGTPPPCAARILTRPAVAIPAPGARARSFVVLPFRNVTRQSQQEWLVEGSTTMLSDALGRWQGIHVVADERLYPAMRRAGAKPGDVIDAAQVRRISEETGGWTAISGDVIATGGRLRITARAWDVPTNKELVRAASEVATDGDVRLAYDSVSMRLLRSVGLDAAVQDQPGASTSSLDGYKAYLRGLYHRRRGELKPALASFQEAVRADSTFALGWARLAETQVSTDPMSMFAAASKSAQAASKAAFLAAKLPPKQRQLVRALDALMHAQFTEARAGLEALVVADSSDVDAMEMLLGLEMFDPILVPVPGGQRPRGSPMRAARLAKRIVELDPARYAVFGVLSMIYAYAGMPEAPPSIAVDRAPSSFPDLMKSLQSMEHVRMFTHVLRDSLVLVPAESLSFIPKDSLKELRRAARAASRAWAERWIAAAQGESAPFVLIAELMALDGEYPGALQALAKAESLGVQNPLLAVPVRRFFYQSKAGNLPVAIRVADSLTTASFFKIPNNMMVNGDAAAWAFALHLLTGRWAAAATLLEQATGMMRMLAPQSPTPGLAAMNMLMGNEDPEMEPGIPRQLRVAQLDTALAHAAELAAAERIGPWASLLVPKLAEVANPKAIRSGDVLKAADQLAPRNPALAWELASNMVYHDSTVAVQAASFEWYRVPAERVNAQRAVRAGRFRPAMAGVTAESATFEWTVDDAAPFTWSTADTPPGRGEYGWEVVLDTAKRRLSLLVRAAMRDVGAREASGTLAQLIPPGALREVSSGRMAANGIPADTTRLGSVILQTEFAPKVLRLKLTDRTLLQELLRDRPAVAKFRFAPCPQAVGVAKTVECTLEPVTIKYP